MVTTKDGPGFRSGGKNGAMSRYSAKGMPSAKQGSKTPPVGSTGSGKMPSGKQPAGGFKNPPGMGFSMGAGKAPVTPVGGTGGGKFSKTQVAKGFVKRNAGNAPDGTSFNVGKAGITPVGGTGGSPGTLPRHTGVDGPHITNFTSKRKPW